MKKLFYKLFLLMPALIILNFSFLINNCLSQWEPTASINENFVQCFAQKGTVIFAGTGNGIYKTTNNGTNWTAINSGLSNFEITSLAVSEPNIFTGTFEGGIFASSNDGANWIQANLGITDPHIYSLAVSGANIYAGTMSGGAFISSNSGSSWTSINNGLTNLWVMNFAFSGTNMFAATWGGGVFLSTNGGNSWTAVNSGLPEILFIKPLAVLGTKIIAGTIGEGVYITTNNGSNWSLSGLTGSDILSLIVSGTNIFAGLHAEGVYFTSNNGANWISKNQGFPFTPDVYAMITANNYIFSNYYYLGNSGPVYRRSYSEIIGIKNITSEIPMSFSLGQNYPNPFNPTTNIKFALPKSSIVKITVFDITGKEIETLVNEQLQAGTYETKWNASNYPSGVYFYKLTTDGFIETKRMLMIK